MFGVYDLWHSTTAVVERAGPCYRCERLVAFAAYCVCTLLSSDEAKRCLCMLSTQLLFIAYDLAYDLSSEHSQLSHTEALHYNKQYPMQPYPPLDLPNNF